MILIMLVLNLLKLVKMDKKMEPEKVHQLKNLLKVENFLAKDTS